MKNLKNFSITIFTFVVSLFFTACTNENDNILNEEEEEILLNLNLKKEFVSIDSEPISRVQEQNDVYCFQVWYIPKNATKEQPYCYGVFDNVDNLKLKVIKGYQYRIVASLVVDGKKKLNTYANLTASPGNTGQTLRDVTNKFISNSDKSIDPESNYWLKLKDGNNYACPNIEKYLCITDLFSPTETNQSVNVFLNKIVFGIKVNAKNLTKGSIKVMSPFSGTYEYYFPTITLTSTKSNNTDFYTYECSYGTDLEGLKRFYTNFTTDNIGLKVVYVSTDGLETILYDDRITVEKLKYTIINISVPSEEDLNKLNQNILIEKENISITDGNTITI